MIYVTGANGWLGLNLIKDITESTATPWSDYKKNINAMILPGSDRKILENINGNVKIFEGNVQDSKSTESFFESSKNGIVIHTAGIIHPKKVKEFYSVNLEGTKNVLKCALKNNIKRVVIVSSNSPFSFNKSHEEPFSEESPYNPYMNYGKSKMMMEEYANHFHKKYGLDITLIRAPWFYGPFQPKRQKRFYEMIKKGSVPIIGSGNNLRSMVYTSNLSQGIMLAALSKIATGKTYWIADKDPYSMNYIISTIEELLINQFSEKCKGTRLRLPNFISDTAVKVDYLIQKLGFYNQEIHVLSEMNKNIFCSIELAQKELLYSPRFSLPEGMKNSLSEVYSKND